MGDGVSEEQEPSKEEEEKTFSEVFHEMFPHYLAMGMTSEDYWEGSGVLAREYREAYRIRYENEKARMEEINDRAAWMNGAYIRQALQSVYLMVNGFVPSGAEAVPYPEKPYTEQAREQKKEEDRKKREERDMKLAMAMMHAHFSNFNRKFFNKETTAPEKNGE